ncbi:hypothetical protein Y032_0015g2631 [Ancylostoma ceylanicum]|uniref:Uncharacterized protein n=1 Tax=Ancylostoma ceylanicum TaxID=53326 RepID=A0A016V7H9_9BILA|nr:hypothetical protein Y032_0015g2631 [Ancylostoma ceylanicum]
MHVRPITEFGTTIMSPCKKKDIMALESVHNNFTRELFLRVTGLSYANIPCGEQRRIQISLPSLASRRKKFDLVMAHKTLTGRLNIESDDFFQLCPSITRGGSLKLRAYSARTQIRSKFLSQRTVAVFNSLLRRNVLEISPSQFKRMVARISDLGTT